MTKQLLSPHFSYEELSCRCGCGMLPEEELIIVAEEVRVELGFPLHPTSGARCKKYNQVVGGAPASYHLKGIALDISCTSELKRWQIINALMKRGLSIRVAKTFIHFDLRRGKPKFGLY